MSNDSHLTNQDNILIDISLVSKIIKKQFPKWSDLVIKQVKSSGWDNRTFHLGDDMSVRLPSAAKYSSQIEKEYLWLPQLAPKLPLLIPTPLAIGEPSKEYPWHWAVYKWLEGESATIDLIADLNKFAIKLAGFLKALQQCDTTGGPITGPENFYRGGRLSIYDHDTRLSISGLDTKLGKTLTSIWEKSLSTTWQDSPVWVHGDIAVGNLLVMNGDLRAVIDFGQLAVGDPACDLAIAWMFFDRESRKLFRQTLKVDNDTWDRGRGWALWKTLCAPVAGTNCQKIIDEIIEDFSMEYLA